MQLYPVQDILSVPQQVHNSDMKIHPLNHEKIFFKMAKNVKSGTKTGAVGFCVKSSLLAFQFLSFISVSLILRTSTAPGVALIDTVCAEWEDLGERCNAHQKRHVGVDSKNKGSWGQTTGPARRAGQSGAASRRTVSRGQRPRQPAPPPVQALLCRQRLSTPSPAHHNLRTGSPPFGSRLCCSFLSRLLHTQNETKCHAIPVPLSFSSSFFLSPSQTCGVPPSFSHSPTALRPLHS